ncbi:SHD1 domain-containing protein [Roseiconus lacunae]|uniref:SHD1 domain-containing protein n=2 Tax=Roseiconus lacunae TaxID=2605694 RepID=UPI0011F19B8F|nr:SHD1 domain-containing protein [Roseiconus lacunae]
MRLWLMFALMTLAFSFRSIAVGREWIDLTGKHRVEAELVAVRGQTVILERADGRIVSLPIDRLSRSDQAFLRKKQSELSPESSETDSDGGQAAPPKDASSPSAAMAVLKKYCHRCHGLNQSDEGGFDSVLDRDQLVTSGMITARNEAKSPLFQRLISQDSPMPPEGEPAPSEHEIAVIRNWIRGGAAPVESNRPSRLTTHEMVFKQIALDVQKLAAADRSFVRYFSIVNLANAGMPKKGQAIYRSALAKLINSLSWNRRLASLDPVDRDEHVFRIDLRDLGWTSKDWDEILSSHPHGVVPDGTDAAMVLKATETEMPIVRADWFLHVASRPPLYHSLAQIPSSDKRLEELLRVDVLQNIKDGRVVRAGFSRSGVSQNNRMIERHESVFGAYWKSYDFAGNTGRKNLFQNPLGPGVSAGTFAHDGGEIIFQLPNGMLGFMLTDHVGGRIDRGPINIVSDPRQGDKTVINGVSCMSCHFGGFIQKTDEVRRQVLANRNVYPKANEILALYQEPAMMARSMQQDTRLYLDALASDEIGIQNPTLAGEPIQMTSRRYQREVNLNTAAAELGIAARQLQRELAGMKDENLARILGALKVPGGVVKRETFDQTYAALASVLGIGKLTGTASRIAAIVRPSARREGNRPGVAGEWAFAFNRGKQHLDAKEWNQAQEQLELAASLAPDAALRATIFQMLVQIYERGESFDDLLEAHLAIIDAQSNPTNIEFSISNLFRSAKAFADRSPVSQHAWQEKMVYKLQVTLPESISNQIDAKLQNRLSRNESDAIALRALKFLVDRIHEDPDRKLEVFAKLYELSGDALDATEKLALAQLQIDRGDARQGALLLGDLATSKPPEERLRLRLIEAKAWTKVSDAEKAKQTLLRAKREVEGTSTKVSLHYLIELSEQFAQLPDRDSAIAVLTTALKNEKTPHQIRDLQNRIERLSAIGTPIDPVATLPNSLGDTNATTPTMPIVEDGNLANLDSAGGQAKPMAPNEVTGTTALPAQTQALLDPNRALRAEAEQHEKLARNSPSIRFSSMSKAAQAWIQAGEIERAKKAIESAVTGLRSKTSSGKHRDHETLSDLYEQVEMKLDALTQLQHALRVVDSEHDVEKLQNKASALLTAIGTLDSQQQQELQPLLDPSYRYRIAAKLYETRSSSTPHITAMNLTRAAGKWLEADAVDEVERVGKEIETAIAKIPTAARYGPHEQLYAKIASVYEAAGLNESAVRCYAHAVEHATQDRQAQRYHQSASVLAEKNNLTLPTFDPEVAKKLDPLNEHRVKAQEQEDKAKENQSSIAYTYWQRAAESWLKAEEHERAIAAYRHVVDHYKQKDRSSEYDFTRIAEFYLKLGEKRLAIEAYQTALRKTRSDYSKKRIIEAINAAKKD